MVRKAPATTKQENRTNEDYMPGITGTGEILQAGSPGEALDKAIAEEAHKKTAEDIMEVPIGGLDSDIAARVNTK